MRGYRMTREQELELKQENGTITLEELKELRDIKKANREKAGIVFLKTRWKMAFIAIFFFVFYIYPFFWSF